MTAIQQHGFIKFHMEFLAQIKKDIADKILLHQIFTFQYDYSETIFLLENCYFDDIDYYQSTYYIHANNIFTLFNIHNPGILRNILPDNIVRSRDEYEFLSLFREGKKRDSWNKLQDLKKSSYKSEVQLLAAYGFKLLFNETRKAELALISAERAAESISDLNDCLKAWLYLFQDEKKALMCLKKMKKEAKECYDLILYANTNFSIFGNHKEFQDKMKHILKLYPDADTVMMVALEWWKLFYDLDKVESLLDDAMKLNLSLYCWIDLAKHWMMIFSNRDKAYFCLEQGEKLIKNDFEIADCALAWQVYLNDLERVRKLLDRDFPHIERSNLFFARADIWFRVFGDRNKYRECNEIGKKELRK